MFRTKFVYTLHAQKFNIKQPIEFSSRSGKHREEDDAKLVLLSAMEPPLVRNF